MFDPNLRTLMCQRGAKMHFYSHIVSKSAHLLFKAIFSNSDSSWQLWEIRDGSGWIVMS